RRRRLTEAMASRRWRSIRSVIPVSSAPVSQTHSLTRGSGRQLPPDQLYEGRISDEIQVLEHRDPVGVFMRAGSLLREFHSIRLGGERERRRRDRHNLWRRGEWKRAELHHLRERPLEPSEFFWTSGTDSWRGDWALRILWRHNKRITARKLHDEREQPQRIF